jgi:hypothetical protein
VLVLLPSVSEATNQKERINMFKSTLLAVITASLLVGTAQLMAQQDPNAGGQGNRPRFDPAQMQQRMMERYKETLEITSDSDWKAIQPLVEKVMTAQRESMMGRFGGMMGRRGGMGGPGGQGGPGGGGQAPELQGAMGELQKAVEGKASNAELKSVIAKVAEERKAKEANVAKAQETLRQVLSVRQEALAVLNGLLPAAAK